VHQGATGVCLTTFLQDWSASSDDIWALITLDEVPKISGSAKHFQHSDLHLPCKESNSAII
jgi:hypothetical protein